MSLIRRSAREERSSALWGTGNRGGEHRSSALWGTGNRGGEHRSRRAWATLAVSVLAMTLPLAATAGNGTGGDKGKSYVAPGVLQAAEKNDKVQVIIQASGGLEDAKKAFQGLGNLKKELGLIGAVAAELPASKIEKLMEIDGLTVTLDAPVKATAFTSTQLWPHENGVAKLWNHSYTMPAIAIVDSGIEKSLPDFDLGARVIHREVIASLPQDPTKLDGRGHGTFVAGIAAGSAPGFAGSAPRANLVDIDVMDDKGQAMTSDVIAAAEWIVANKDRFNIRVANFSLHSSGVLSIRHHPLNKAVEKLWFAGVVVVAPTGNYGMPTGPSGVKHAPGNDPFVLTVGALDINGSAKIGDDSVAPWSAYGYTNEGFMKPEVVAAGRYMVGPVGALSSLASERPEKIVQAGYMQLSGTSFSAPVVAGIAAQIIARNPTLTPDQVKGAIMKTARRVPNASFLQQGRGQINAVRSFDAKSFPNPNASLNRFVKTDPVSGNMWDAAAWYDAAWSDKAAWDSAAWYDAAWNDAAWNDAAWNDAAWADAAWNDAAWADAAWADSTAYEDNAAGDPTSPDIVLEPVDELDIAADPDLALTG